jgi:hypothetical protein
MRKALIVLGKKAVDPVQCAVPIARERKCVLETKMGLLVRSLLRVRSVYEDGRARFR